MTDDPLAAKHRIDQALEALRLGLTPFVSQRMASMFGNNWRSRASRAFCDGENQALDVYALLKTILDNWHNGFGTDTKLRKARNYLYVALDARNNVAHFAGSIEQREALRYLDAILELLGAVGAAAQQDVVIKLYAQQQAGVLPSARSPGQLTAASHGPVPKTVSPSRKDTLDLDGALVLVSCVKSKLPRAAPARSLYTSTWFTGVREIVEASSARWFVLSSRYGLVAPDAVIAPYEYTLNTLGVADRRTWADHVLEKLLPEIGGCRRVVMFAGRRYREFLLEPLGQRGITVEVPMENLTQGKQLAWLKQHC